MKGVEAEVAQKAIAAASVSAEEMNAPVSEKAPAWQKPQPASAKTEASDPVQLAAQFIRGLKTRKNLIAAKERVEINPDFSVENKKWLNNLISNQLKKVQ